MGYRLKVALGNTRSSCKNPRFLLWFFYRYLLPRNLPTRLVEVGGLHLFGTLMVNNFIRKFPSGCIENLEIHEILRYTQTLDVWPIYLYLGSLRGKWGQYTVHWASGILRCCTEKLKILGYMEILHSMSDQTMAEYALFLVWHKVSESSAHVYVLALPPTQDPSGKWRFIRIPY